MLDSELNRNRLCMPSVVSLHSVVCVYAPEPETSSLFCSGVPHATRDLSLRWVPGEAHHGVPKAWRKIYVTRVIP